MTGLVPDYLVFDEFVDVPTGSLRDFIATNTSGPLSEAIIDNAIESGYPEVYSNQFEAEVIPE